jgi:hypothetical protein
VEGKNYLSGRKNSPYKKLCKATASAANNTPIIQAGDRWQFEVNFAALEVSLIPSVLIINFIYCSRKL